MGGTVHCIGKMNTRIPYVAVVARRPDSPGHVRAPCVGGLAPTGAAAPVPAAVLARGLDPPGGLGVARAVQAATAPTEGQRVLQSGYNGAIAGGESRERVSTSIGADGTAIHERLSERSVELPEEDVNIQTQQAKQTVEVPSGHTVDGLAGRMLTMSNFVQLKIIDLETKTNTLEAKNAELEAKTDALATKNAELEAINTDTNKRLKALEGKRRRVGAASGHLKKHRVFRADHTDMPKNIQIRDGGFGWKRTMHGLSNSKQGFSSIELAQASMREFYGGTDAAVRSMSTIGHLCALTER